MTFWQIWLRQIPRPPRGGMASRYDGLGSGPPDPLPPQLAEIARQLRASHSSDIAAICQRPD